MSSTETVRVVLSGCSGAGKSSLIDAMARRDYRTVPEAGRRVVATGPTPWDDPAGFVASAAALAAEDYDRAPPGLSLFDRSLVDLVSYLAFKHLSTPLALREIVAARPYAKTVVWAEPWPEIYVDDGARGKAFGAARREAEALAAAYDALGYRRLVLPAVPLAERADWLADTLADTRAGLTP